MSDLIYPACVSFKRSSNFPCKQGELLFAYILNFRCIDFYWKVAKPIHFLDATLIISNIAIHYQEDK